jgi:hypothetical protein
MQIGIQDRLKRREVLLVIPPSEFIEDVSRILWELDGKESNDPRIWRLCG